MSTLKKFLEENVSSWYGLSGPCEITVLDPTSEDPSILVEMLSVSSKIVQGRLSSSELEARGIEGGSPLAQFAWAFDRLPEDGGIVDLFAMFAARPWLADISLEDLSDRLLCEARLPGGSENDAPFWACEIRDVVLVTDPDGVAYRFWFGGVPYSI